MACLREMIVLHDIRLPETLLTDRELALMNALQTHFPSSRHLLCQWHVARNVQSKTRKWFPAPPKPKTGEEQEDHPLHIEFMDEWENLLDSPSIAEYIKRKCAWEQRGWPSGAISYCTKTWLLWKEKLVTCWVDDVPHFGNTTTSRLEGLHACMKKYIRVSTSDLLGVFRRLHMFSTNQHKDIESKTAKQRDRRPEFTRHEMFQLIAPKVHDAALKIIWEEVQKLDKKGAPPKRECLGHTRKANGLPCQHDIFRERHRCILQLHQIHHHWFVITPELGTVFPPNHSDLLRAPATLKRKAKSTKGDAKRRRHGWSGGDSSTQRNLSEWEYEAPFYASETTFIPPQPRQSNATPSLTTQPPRSNPPQSLPTPPLVSSPARQRFIRPNITPSPFSQPPPSVIQAQAEKPTSSAHRVAQQMFESIYEPSPSPIMANWEQQQLNLTFSQRVN